jgi:hypothetical protein
MASINALPQLSPRPNGYVGLDPFRINSYRMKIDPSISTLDWGISKTTCAVRINQAAKPAYEISSPEHRIFYRVDNVKERIAHCVFTDSIRPIVCGLKKDGGWVAVAVAESIHIFVDAIANGTFEKDAFVLDAVKDGQVELFVNGDDPDAKSEL